MRKTVFCTAMGIIMSLACFGQQQKPQPGRTVTLDSGTRIDGQLQSAVDVKRAHVGDAVVLKTTKDIKQSGKTVVPKGSQLLGRVTEVQQRTKQNTISRLGLIFDRIKGQDLSTPISASIVNVTNAAAGMTLADNSADSDLFSSSNTSARSGGGASSGGLLGGVTNSVGGVLNTTTATAGSVTNGVGNTVGNTVGTVGQTAGGLQISNSAAASARSGTTLSAAGRDVRLEKGATIQLQLNNAAGTE